ncbi:MAG TPA: hypothetical protein VNN75_01850 [Stellaceae bacterium]|nr:hypothetical protein [Stellaceae bacterium]
MRACSIVRPALSLTEFERDPLLSDRGAGHAGLNNFRSFADALD